LFLPQKWDSLSHAKGDEYIRKKLISEEKANQQGKSNRRRWLLYS
jgi:hypothetical protein